MNVKVRRAAASAETAAGVVDPVGALGCEGGRPTRICTLRFNLHRRSNILVLVAKLDC